MTDPLRSDRDAASADVLERDRDARIEELLVAGLDHYFSEQYELAINVWTRVLFIDRGHARARAYIERARSAIGERLRKGDEMLHAGAAALDRGDPTAARDLLASAVQHGASGDEALALLSRIERLETAAQTWASAPSLPRSAATLVADGPRARTRLKWIAIGLGTGALMGAAAIVLLVQRGIVAWPLMPRTDVAAVTSPLATTLPVPSLAEIALSRAQALQSRGRLREALESLEPISSGDPLRARADELKAVVQRQLLNATNRHP